MPDRIYCPTCKHTAVEGETIRHAPGCQDMGRLCSPHVPSLAMGFVLLDSRPYCVRCGKKIEVGDPITRQP